MAVLTQQQYSEIEKEKNIKSEEGRIKKVLPSTVNKKPEIKYYLFHPDNPKSRYLNDKYHVRIGGLNFYLEIIEGVITTNDEEVKTHLLAKGFIFMYKKEISNE